MAPARRRCSGFPPATWSRPGGAWTDLRRNLYAALYVTDFRGAVLLNRSATGRIAGAGRRSWLPRPRNPLLAVPWRDAVWAVRHAGHVGSAAVLAVGATLWVLVAPGSPLVLFGAVALCYFGASRLVEPLRVESDAPGAALRLPYRHGDLILLHTLVPAALLAATLALSCIAAYLAGLLSAGGLFAGFVLCVPGSAALVACAAVIARRSRTLPPSVIEAATALGEAGGFVVLQWYAAGPTLALVAVGVPGLFLSAAAGPTVPWTAVAGAAAYLSLFAAAVLRGLRRGPSG